MRFLIDENLPCGVADLFGNAGHEVAQVFEEDLGGETDGAVSALCHKKDYCLVTMDEDFAKVGAWCPPDHPGIIIIHLEKQGLRGLFNIVPRLLMALRNNAVRGRFWVVERNGIRVRLEKH